MRSLCTTLFFLGCLWAVKGQSIQLPEDFLGYPLGTTFTRHHQIVDYFEYVAEQSPAVVAQRYGKTYEGRPLMTVVVTSPENHAHIAEIKANNLKAVGFVEGEPTDLRLPIVWLSYNIHGNEPSPSEAAMKTLHSLVTEHADWLDSVVVIMDPCINPDGRDRYVNWYRQAANATPNIDPKSWEHQEEWPGGRSNHYLFDLNRDWCWQTQVESRQRAKFYHQWMPQVHCDYHEMGHNAPYYFGPAARPYHEILTEWQYDFQELVGRNHAMYFDKEHWLYYTREFFDLFYPSYGDTWPMYQGAVGFTYEQGGHGMAGRAILMDNGDTLTLADRILHHHTTGLSTVETSIRHANQLISQFDDYFAAAREGIDEDFDHYVVQMPPDFHDREAFLDLMKRNQIKYIDWPYIHYDLEVVGYSYRFQELRSFTISETDIVIPTAQSQGHLLKVLFEAESTLEDSLTYDLTAWTIPYAFGLEVIGTKDYVPLASKDPFVDALVEAEDPTPLVEPYTICMKWQGLGSVQALTAAMKAGFQARMATKEMVIAGDVFPAGSILFTKADNQQRSLKNDLWPILAHTDGITVLETGFSENGIEVGSESNLLLKTPSVALVKGDEVNVYAFGELWYYFEQDLRYPVTVLNTGQLSAATLSDIDVLILPSGSYQEGGKVIRAFLQRGGKVIALDKAMHTFAQGEGNLSVRGNLGHDMDLRDHAHPHEVPFAEKDRKELSGYTAGSIYPVKLDATHPLAYGIGDSFYLLKRSNTIYDFMPSGDNVGIIEDGKPLNGFTGYKLQEKVAGSLAIGTERMGAGKVVYFVDSPIFRGFWHSGKLLLANAVLLW